MYVGLKEEFQNPNNYLHRNPKSLHRIYHNQIPNLTRRRRDVEMDTVGRSFNTTTLTWPQDKWKLNNIRNMQKRHDTYIFTTDHNKKTYNWSINTNLLLIKQYWSSPQLGRVTQFIIVIKIALRSLYKFYSTDNDDIRGR